MKIRTALESLVTLFGAEVDGTTPGSDYTYDLTATDAVRIGVPTQSDLVPPCLWLAPGALETPERDAEFTSHHRSLVVEFYGCIGCDEQDSGTRVLAATDFLDDLCRALDAWDPNIEEYDVTLDAPDITGGALGSNAAPLVAGTITINWITDIGGGA